jgi:hypothetical protein
MTVSSRKPSRRNAAALIETVAVVLVFLLFLFGVLEYCRFLFIRQLTANATREGARFAVVNTSSPTLDADVKAKVKAMMGGMDGSSGIRNFTVQVYAGNSSAGMNFEYTPGASATYAYQTDSSGNKYMIDNTTPTPVKFNLTQDASKNWYVVDTANSNTKVYLNLNTITSGVSGQNTSAFNTFVTSNKIMNVMPAGDTQFGTYIVVQIDCDYDPILPVFLLMPNTLHIQTKSAMYSEAN